MYASTRGGTPLSADDKLRKDGVRVVYHRGGKTDKRVLKVETKGGRTQLIILSRLTMTGRNRKALELA